MVKMQILYLIAVVAAVLGQGCATRQQAVHKQRICRAGFEKGPAMKIAEDVLGSMYFKIEKADIKQGYIRTKPLAGGQFFEVWRADSLTARDSIEANLHSIQKIVELNFTEQPGRVCIDCATSVRRLSLTEHEVNSTAKAYMMFSESSSALQKLKVSDKQKRQIAWLDLGPDVRLQTEILNRIEKQLAKLLAERKEQ